MVVTVQYGAEVGIGMPGVWCGWASAGYDTAGITGLTHGLSVMVRTVLSTTQYKAGQAGCVQYSAVYSQWWYWDVTGQGTRR